MSENITITINTILAFFGGVTCLVGGMSALAKIFNPFKSLKAKVQDHDTRLNNDFKRLSSLDTTIKDVDKTNRVICKSLLVLLNHEITGNGIDKLKMQRDELEQFLIDR